MLFYVLYFVIAKWILQNDSFMGLFDSYTTTFDKFTITATKHYRVSALEHINIAVCSNDVRLNVLDIQTFIPTEYIAVDCRHLVLVQDMPEIAAIYHNFPLEQVSYLWYHLSEKDTTIVIVE